MISEMETNKKIARIKPVCLQGKGGTWPMPIFNDIQPRGRQEAAFGHPGDCKSLKCSSFVWHRSFLLHERAKCGSSAWFWRDRQCLGKSCGRTGILQMQRGLGMDPDSQTRRCLRMRSWLREAEWAVGGWYLVNEDFSYVAGLIDQKDWCFFYTPFKERQWYNSSIFWLSNTYTILKNWLYLC